MAHRWEADAEQEPEQEAIGPAITQVHYQRLVSTGNYENERVGGWATVRPGQSPDAVLAELRGWVAAQVGLVEEQNDLRRACDELGATKRELERAVLGARERYDRAKRFVESLGLTMPDRYDNLDAMPW